MASSVDKERREGAWRGGLRGVVRAGRKRRGRRAEASMGQDGSGKHTTFYGVNGRCFEWNTELLNKGRALYRDTA